MTVKTKLISILEEIQKPVILQGSMAENAAYPDSFITFFVSNTEDNAHYDNDTKKWAWDIQIVNYSNNPLTVAEQAEQIRKRLKEAGFIPQGKGYDIASNEPTHTGWANDYFYIENESEE